MPSEMYHVSAGYEFQFLCIFELVWENVFLDFCRMYASTIQYYFK